MGQESLFSAEEFNTEFQHLVRKRPRRSIDEAREFFGWTVHKLDIFSLYLKLYRRVAGNGTYIDGFAGEGRAIIDGQEKPGSAARALESGAFKRLRLYERPRNSRKLEEWLDANATDRQRQRVQIVAGDFNKNVLSDLASETFPLDKPCFAFLDPDSTQLDWSTVEALARYKQSCSPPDTCRVELWILFNSYQALPRLLPRSTTATAFLQEDTLNRWLGGEAGWRDLYDGGHRRPQRYADRYAQRLMDELGYGLARSITIRDPATGRPQYHMIHASDHPAAHEFMTWAAGHAHPKDSEAIPLPGFDRA